MSFLKGIGGDILGTLSPAAGLISGKGLGGLLGKMSPLGMLLHGSHGDSDGSAPAKAPLAQRIGEAANTIAATGGATPGYYAPPSVGAAPQPAAAPAQGAPSNHFQYLDDATLRKLIPGYQPPSQGGGIY